MNLLIRFARYLLEFAFGAVVVAAAITATDGPNAVVNYQWPVWRTFAILAFAMAYPAYRARRWLTSLLR
ncbi:MAG: hypothetical protein KGZ54_11835 [Dethiobacter sp.]|nr:hypothetical protein [Dethiobacter sp.]MBS3902688.1 hypothetical protein [Dethiobacter sp.]MBS3989739.1 hypothetical protein [Dethiobacter sp.]